MEIKVDPKTFTKALELAVPVTQKDSTFLSNLLLVANGNTVCIKATNLDVSISVLCDAVVKKVGTTCVNGEKLLTKFKNLSSETKIKVAANNWLQIESGTKKSKLPALEAERFPSFPDPAEANLVLTTVEQISKLLKSTAFAITEEETRYNLFGVKLSVKDGTGIVLATDGGRIVYAKESVEGDFEVFIPKKVIPHILKLPKEELRIHENTNHMFFETENIMLVGRKATGTFPDCEKMLAFKTTNKVDIPFENLKSSFKYVNTTYETKDINPVNFSIDKNTLHLKTRSATDGESEDSIEITYEGKPFSVHLNSAYLIDFFNSINPETLTMNFTDVNSPIIFTFGKNNYKFLLMGMKT